MIYKMFTPNMNYNSINSVNNIENDTNEISNYYNKIKSNIDYVCSGIGFIIGYILLFVLLLFILYIISIVFGIIIIILDTSFEYTIVFLFGKEIYKKNFPVCSSTEYIGINCYKTTSTFCI